MTRQIVFRAPSSSVKRREPLLADQSTAGTMRFGEVAGGTAAECAAICCCCPCGLMNLLILAVYKLPAGLCRKLLKKKRRKGAKKTGLLPQRRVCSCGCDETAIQVHPVSGEMWANEKTEKSGDSAKEVQEMEKEMWDKFYSTGFWRSPSQSQH
ncbi:hypothetical protein HHK36_017949 [Tetracentron sinense]|uniref:Pollen preferential protein n=1 Tax=Tetracentron sinense TaxID=13715 RepID=A0A835D9V9_TETSI|nr:hypothetical protein HHK36_017949 [Tetracentron sinense]